MNKRTSRNLEYLLRTVSGEEKWLKSSWGIQKKNSFLISQIFWTYCWDRGLQQLCLVMLSYCPLFKSYSHFRILEMGLTRYRILLSLYSMRVHGVRLVLLCCFMNLTPVIAYQGWVAELGCLHDLIGLTHLWDLGKKRQIRRAAPMRGQGERLPMIPEIIGLQWWLWSLCPLFTAPPIYVNLSTMCSWRKFTKALSLLSLLHEIMVSQFPSSPDSVHMNSEFGNSLLLKPTYAKSYIITINTYT